MRDHLRAASLDEYSTYIHSLERYIALHKKLRNAKTELFNKTVAQWSRNAVPADAWPHRCFAGKPYAELMAPTFQPTPYIALDDSSRALSTLLMFVEVELDFENLPAPETTKTKSWFGKLARLFFVRKSTKKKLRLGQQYSRLYMQAVKLRKLTDDELYRSLPAYKQFQTMAQRSIRNLNLQELNKLGIKDVPNKAKQQISFSSLLALSDGPYAHPTPLKLDSGVEIRLNDSADTNTSDSDMNPRGLSQCTDSRSEIGLDKAFDGFDATNSENPFQLEELDVGLEVPTFQVGEICSPGRTSLDSELTRVSTYSIPQLSQDSHESSFITDQPNASDPEWKEDGWDELKGMCAQLQENYIKTRLHAELRKES